jgi:hypothetical protein
VAKYSGDRTNTTFQFPLENFYCIAIPEDSKRFTLIYNLVLTKAILKRDLL